MFLDECGDFCATLGNWQGVVERRFGDKRVPLLANQEAVLRLCQRRGELLIDLIVRSFLAREVLALFCERDQASAISRQHLQKINLIGRHAARILRVHRAESASGAITPANYKITAVYLRRDNAWPRSHARLFASHCSIGVVQ